MRNRRSAGLGRPLPPNLGRLRRGSGVQRTGGEEAAQAGGDRGVREPRLQSTVVSRGARRRVVVGRPAHTYARKGARTPLSTHLGLKIVISPDR